MRGSWGRAMFLLLWELVLINILWWPVIALSAYTGDWAVAGQLARPWFIALCVGGNLLIALALFRGRYTFKTAIR